MEDYWPLTSDLKVLLTLIVVFGFLSVLFKKMLKIPMDEPLILNKQQ